MAIGTFVRWGAGDGIAGRMVKASARRGDMHARIAVDRSLRADPYPYYDEIRARGPLVPGRLAMITAHHRVAAQIISENWQVGIPAGLAPPALMRLVERFRDPEALGALQPPSLLATNPPDHTRLRRLVSRAFTARAVERLHGRVTDIATELLDALERDHRNGPRDGHRVDLVSTYAAALPALVIADVLGVPRELHPTFLRWGHAISPTLDIGIGYATFKRAEDASRELNRWLRGHFEVLRKDPGEGILGGIVALADRPDGSAQGAALSDVELTSVAGLVLAAGFETTVNLLGNAVVALLAHPDQLAGLQAEPAGWRNAVEEVLRYDSPVQFLGRHPVADTVVAGVPVPAGRIVAMVLGGVNRDPEVFADPHRFDVTRANAREHLAFGGGAHHCLGAALARLEGEVGLRLLFERFPDLQIAGLPRRRPTRVLRGYENLPVDLRARTRVAT